MAISFRKPKVVFLTFFCLAVACLCFYASYVANERGFGLWYFGVMQLLMVVNFTNAWSNFIKWMEYK